MYYDNCVTVKHDLLATVNSFTYIQCTVKTRNKLARSRLFGTLTH